MRIALLELLAALVLIVQQCAEGAAREPLVPVRHLFNSPPLYEVKIVGGTEAIENEFPFLAYLQLNFSGTAGFQQLCGSSIYNEKYVITAAHCVKLPEGFKPYQLRIIAGEHNVGIATIYEQIRLVKTIHIHPDFSLETLLNDIAILELESPLIFSDQVAAIPLAKNDPAVNSRVTVAGWGRLKPTATTGPPVPYKVSVRMYTNAQCSRLYRIFHEVTDNMLCAGNRFPMFGRRGSCPGDSGGPLFTETKPRQLIGVVSWGMGCAFLFYPQVYTRLSSYRDFITSIAGPGI